MSSFICPYPLVHSNSSIPIKQEFEVHWAYEAGNCAVRCPTITLTEDEMSVFYNHMKWISTASCIVSTLLLLFYIRDIDKRFLVVMFLLGFWLESVTLFFFLPLNKDYDLICDDESHYIPRQPLCVTQSFFVIYSFVWVMTWGAIYTVDIYFQVQFRIGATETKKYRQYYLLFVFLATTCIATIPLGAENLGYDYTTSLQTCIFLFGDNQAYFWLFLVLPFTVMLFTSLIFSILTFKRLHHIFVDSQLRQNKKTAAGRAVSDVDSAQDEYADRMRFNYWSTDELENDFDTDGRVMIKSTIPNPLNVSMSLHPGMSFSQGGLELSHSTYASDGDTDGSGHFDVRDLYSSDVSMSMDDRSVLHELEEARRSGISNGSSVIGGGKPSMRGTGGGRAMKGLVHSREDDEETRDSSFGGTVQSADRARQAAGLSGNKSSNLWICLNKTWKYNGRMILFLLFFCACAIYILPTLVYLFYTKYDQYVHGTESYITCLVTASLTSDVQDQASVNAHALAVCGTHPEFRPPFYLFMSVSYWAAAFGLIPLVIFGKAPINFLKNRLFSASTTTSGNNVNTLEQAMRAT